MSSLSDYSSSDGDDDVFFDAESDSGNDNEPAEVVVAVQQPTTEDETNPAPNDNINVVEDANVEKGEDTPVVEEKKSEVKGIDGENAPTVVEQRKVEEPEFVKPAPKIPPKIPKKNRNSTILQPSPSKSDARRPSLPVPIRKPKADAVVEPTFTNPDAPTSESSEEENFDLPVAHDEDEMLLLRNLVRNLDTGEVCQIEIVDEVFDEVAKTNTMAELLENFNAEQQAPQDGKASLNDAELKESRKSMGFLSTMKKVFSRGHDSLTGKNGPVNQVKGRHHNKKTQRLTDLRLIQQVTQHVGPIWTMVWSHDGQYLATGGQDSIVRVWAVVGSAEESKLASEQQGDEESSGELPPELQTKIIHPKPLRMYSGHKADVIDLAWSRENFLLSASIDKTVRLWHVSRKKSLSLFQHSDFVTSVCFHPVEDRFFLSGSFDKKLRIWNIPEHRVVEWAQTANIVTATSFNHDGTMAVAGLYNGQCIFYQTQGLKYFTQIDCRNRHGKYRKGKKVTALQFSNDGKQLLITTNDSRIRLYDMNDYSMLAKFKGLANDELQIRAGFSPDNTQVICGSENEQAYIWDTRSDFHGLMTKENHNDSYEYFKANRNTCTSALFVPPATITLALGDAATRTKHMFVTTGYEGDIKFFENQGQPKQL